MAFGRRRPQGGFTLIEMMIAVAIVAILAGIAAGQMRDYTRRSKISEVVLALSRCKNTISENYLTFERAPQPGAWGCEQQSSSSAYTGTVQTSSDGAIRIAIDNLDATVNGQHVYLVPVKLDGSTPLQVPTDLGRGVPAWLCGSDVQSVRKALPANCRADTSLTAAATFQ
jgi:type IV pilus assembly protein PilA